MASTGSHSQSPGEPVSAGGLQAHRHPVTTPHSRLQRYSYGDPSPQVFSHCPSLSPAVPLSPYGHTCSRPSVPVWFFFNWVTHREDAIGEVYTWGSHGVHRVDPGASRPHSKHFKSGTRGVNYLLLCTKPMWVLGASPVLLAVPSSALSWRYICPLAQHRWGPSREYHGRRRGPQGWAPTAWTGCSLPWLLHLAALAGCPSAG